MIGRVRTRRARGGMEARRKSEDRTADQLTGDMANVPGVIRRSTLQIDVVQVLWCSAVERESIELTRRCKHI